MKNKIDMDEMVYVQLTPFGISAFKEYHKKIVALCPATSNWGGIIARGSEQQLKLKWMHMALWELMMIFGNYCGNGQKKPFVDGIHLTKPAE